MNAKEITPVNCYLMALAPTGRRSMKSQLSQVAILLGKTTIDDIAWHQLEYQQLIYIRSQLQAAGKSVNTINTTLAALRGVTKTSFKMGLVTADYMARVSQIENVRGSTQGNGTALSLEESRKLVKKASEELGPKGLRDSALLILMLSVGLRRSETVALNQGSFDFDRRRIYVMGKGGKVRHHDISGVTFKKLKQWAAACQANHEDSPFFTQVVKSGITSKRLTANSIYRIVRTYGELINMKGLRPHDLRRTYVSLLLEQGVDLNTVSQAIGHSSVNVTARYDRRSINVQTAAVRQLSDNLGRGM